MFSLIASFDQIALTTVCQILRHGLFCKARADGRARGEDMHILYLWQIQRAELTSLHRRVFLQGRTTLDQESFPYRFSSVET